MSQRKAHESKSISEDDIERILTRETEENPKAYRKRVVDFYNSADPASARLAVELAVSGKKLAKMTIKGKSLDLLLYLKFLSGQSPEEKLLYLVARLPHEWGSNSINRGLFENILLELLRENPQFKKTFCTHPAAFQIEEILTSYCAAHAEDVAMQEILAEYQTSQSSQEGEQARETYYEEELRKFYGFDQPLGKFQKDIVHIAFFLMDETRVVKRLQDLNDRIVEAVKKEQPADERKKQPSERHDLLPTVLQSITTEVGFTAPTQLQASPKTFNALYEHKSLPHDRVFAGELHGEWTHYLQWTLVSLEYLANKKQKTDFLNHAPSDVFHWLKTQRGKKIWHKTFEIPSAPYTKCGFDARFVFDFDKYVRSPVSAATFPLLQQLVQSWATQGEQDKQNRKAVKDLKNLCEKNARLPGVQELQAALEEKGDATKAHKPAEVITAFTTLFTKKQKEFPKKFVHAVQGQLPVVKKSSAP